MRGLGDVLAWALHKLGITQQPNCGCARRQELLNQWFPFPKG